LIIGAIPRPTLSSTFQTLTTKTSVASLPCTVVLASTGVDVVDGDDLEHTKDDLEDEKYFGFTEEEKKLATLTSGQVQQAIRDKMEKERVIEAGPVGPSQLPPTPVTTTVSGDPMEPLLGKKKKEKDVINKDVTKMHDGKKYYKLEKGGAEKEGGVGASLLEEGMGK